MARRWLVHLAAILLLLATALKPAAALGKLKGFVKELGNKADKAFNDAKTAVSTAGYKAESAFSDVKSAISNAGNKVESAFNDAKSTVGGVASDMATSIQSGARQAAEFAKSVTDCSLGRGRGTIDACGWDGRRYNNRACMLSHRVGKVKDGACPNYNAAIPRAPRGKNNWASDYYPLIPRKLSLDFPPPPPYKYKKMPACNTYAFKDVLNNPVAFDTKRGVSSNEVIYMTLQLSTSVYFPFKDVALKEWWTCLGARDVAFIKTRDQNEAVLMRTDNTVLVVVQGSQSGESDFVSRDWLSNLDFKMVSAAFLGAPRGARVHQGFLEALRDLVGNGKIVGKLTAMCEKLDADKDGCRVVLTGHSRGAVLSQLLAAHLVNKGWTNIAGVFAHQGPKPGDTAFKRYYEETLRLGPRTVRLYLKRDSVSGYDFLGVKDYRHVGMSFEAESCTRREPEKDRDYGNLLDHFPSRAMLNLFAVCPWTKAGLRREAVLPPMYPEGAFGLGARTTKVEVGLAAVGQAVGRR
jgi:hypothetical protein